MPEAADPHHICNRIFCLEDAAAKIDVYSPGSPAQGMVWPTVRPLNIS